MEAGFFLFLTQCFRDVGRGTHIRGLFDSATVATDIATADWFTISQWFAFSSQCRNFPSEGQKYYFTVNMSAGQKTINL